MPDRDTRQTDVLGAPYVAETIQLAPDDEGDVVATLVHRPADAGPSRRAVLHVHGFSDYFFQTGAAEYWTARGYDFYALDLRKYGRSLRPHQSATYVDDLATYDEDLDAAWERVTAEHDRVVLSAHSTGGLVVPLWLDRRGAEVADRVAGVVLNSPWLDMMGDRLTRHVLMPIVGVVGARQPLREIPRTVEGVYARSLHEDFDGEWPFDLRLKPIESFPIRFGWLRAIRQGHARIATGLSITAPILVVCSTRSAHPRTNADPDASSTDIVLDVQQIRRRAPLLGRHVTLAMIEGALHDVTLSREPVRKQVFGEFDRFLTAYVD